MRPGVRVLKGHHVYESNGSTDIALALAGITVVTHMIVLQIKQQCLYIDLEIYMLENTIRCLKKKKYISVDNLFIIIYPNSDIFMSGKEVQVIYGIYIVVLGC